MHARRWSVSAAVLLWAGSVLAADPPANPRQFQLELPSVVTDPDVGVTVPKWVQNNRIPEDEWSRNHRVGMRLIDATPEPAPGGNSVALIRAVNHLHAMGREEAVRVLRDYAARNFDTGDWRLAPIVQLLFSPVDPKGMVPPREWYDLQQESWRVTDVGIIVCGDIPFYVLDGFTLEGWIPQTTALVEWAAQYGRFRTEPLRPTTNASEAAEQAITALAQNASVKASCGSAEQFQRFIDRLRPIFQKHASLVASQQGVSTKH